MTTVLPEVPPGASTGDRLKAAIITLRGHPSVKAFADATGVKYENLVSIVNGRRKLTDAKAVEYATLLEVPATWLTTGVAEPVNGAAAPANDRVPVVHVLSPKWTGREERTPHVPKAVQFPLAVSKVARKDLFAAFCDDAIGVCLRRGSYVICAGVGSGAHGIGYLVKETNGQFTRTLPWFHLGVDGEHGTPTETRVLRLEPMPPPDIELVGVIVAAWMIAA